jgi:hypothetical protein
MRLAHRLAYLIVIGTSLAAWSNVAFAAEVEPQRLMPETATFYAEISQPLTLLDQARGSPWIAQLERSDKARQVYQSGGFRKFKTAVTLIETRLGRKWPAIARELAGSVHFAYDVTSQTSLLVLKPQRAETLAELHEAIVKLIELDATSKGSSSPIESAAYGQISTWSFGPQDHHAIAAGLLLQSNQLAGLHAAIDRLTDKEPTSLADTAFYREAREAAGSQAVGWSVVRLEELRNVSEVSQALDGKSDNPLAELVAGGIFGTLRTSPWVVSSLHMDQNQLRLRTELPRTSDASATRDWYFPAPEDHVSAAPLRLPRTLLSLSSYRDAAGMWQARDELFNEETAAKLAQADTNLGLYFAGQDFGTQILSEFRPHWRLAIARQQYEPGQPIPAIKLPALAFVMELKNPQSFGTTMLVSFQKTIGLINLVGGQQGQQQLLLTSESYRGANISKATYLFDDATNMQAAPIYYNASPSCALMNNNFIVGTTTEIVRQTIDALASTNSSEEAAVNTRVRIDLAEIAAALADNRALLVSQNVLKEGHSTEQAEQEIDLVLELLRWARQASLSLDNQPPRLILEVTAGGEP